MVSYEVVLDIDGTEQRHSFTALQEQELMVFWRNIDRTGALNGRPVFAGYCWMYDEAGDKTLMHQFEQ